MESSFDGVLPIETPQVQYATVTEGLAGQVVDNLELALQPGMRDSLVTSGPEPMRERDIKSSRPETRDQFGKPQFNVFSLHALSHGTRTFAPASLTEDSRQAPRLAESDSRIMSTLGRGMHKSQRAPGDARSRTATYFAGASPCGTGRHARSDGDRES